MALHSLQLLSLLLTNKNSHPSLAFVELAALLRELDDEDDEEEDDEEDEDDDEVECLRSTGLASSASSSVSSIGFCSTSGVSTDMGSSSVEPWRMTSDLAMGSGLPDDSGLLGADNWRLMAFSFVVST